MRIFLRVAGPIIFLAGLGFCVSGMADFLSTFSAVASPNPEFRMPTKFWHWFAGIPLVGVGGMMIKFGYLRPISKYIANETSDSVSIFSKAFRGTAATHYCEACGEKIRKTANFCSHCGVDKT